MGIIFLVSTPIGNLDDITIRAIKTLSSVDIILCEDTRKTGILLQHLSIRKPLVRYDDATEHQKTPEIIEVIEHGKNVALVSDAGTPLINDPGFLLVREAMKRGIKVTSIPGPTAAIAALTISGLPANKFLFLGYPPEKQTNRVNLLRTIQQYNNITIIIYCAPHKLTQTLTDMKEVFGDIEIVLARELTKVHEEIWSGNISTAQTKIWQGEIVLLIKLT